MAGRWDAGAYRTVCNYSSRKFETGKLSAFAFINPKTDFSRLDTDTEISFVPMEAVDESNGAVSELRLKKIKEAKGFTRFQENDLIWAKISPCMQNGKSAVARNLKQGFACGSTEFYVIRPKSGKVLADYLHFLLRDESVLENAQKFFAGSAGQQRVPADFLRNLKIPVPPREIQAEIVALYQAACVQKHAKEAEAKALLAGTHGYLLDKLGIRLPVPTERKKFFYVRASQVNGARFDALFHQTDLFGFIKTGKFALVKFKETVTYLQNGFAAGKQNQNLDGTGIIQIRPGNIKEPERDLDFAKNVYIKPEEAQKRNSDLLCKNEVLFNNTNSQDLVGKTALFALDGTYFCSNHMTRIGVNENLSPFYLTLILNLYQHLNIFYRMCVNWNNQSGVNAEMLRDIPVPMPRPDIQTEISDHIAGIRAKAKQLKQEAKEITEQARQKVKQIILGE